MKKIVLIVLSVVTMPTVCFGSKFPRMCCMKKDQRISILDEYCKKKSAGAVNKKGETILFYVKCHEAVELLVDARADVNHQREDGETALSKALSKKTVCSDLVLSLLEAGASPWVENKKGESLLSRLDCKSSGYLWFGDRCLGALKKESGNDAKYGVMLRAIQAAAV